MGANLCRCETVNLEMEDKIETFQRRYSKDRSLEEIRSMSKYYIETRKVPSEDAYTVEMLLSLNQFHIAYALKNVRGDEKAELLRNIKEVDLEQIDILFHNAKKNEYTVLNYKYHRQYIEEWYKINRYYNIEVGEYFLKNGKIAVMTCLGCFDPKDYPQKGKISIKSLDLPSQKSSLYIIFERIVSLYTQYCTKIPIILVCDYTWEQDLTAWIDKLQYELDIHISIYRPHVPLVNEKGCLLFKNETSFLYTRHEGDILFSLKKFRVLELLEKLNVDYVHFINPNNLLETVCEPGFIGLAARKNVDVLCCLVHNVNEVDWIDSGLYLTSSPRSSITFAKCNILPYPCRIHMFAKNCLFKKDFLCKKLFNYYKVEVSKNLEYHKLVASYYDPISSRYVFESRLNARIFVRNLSSLVVGNNVKFIAMPRKNFADVKLYPDAIYRTSNFYKSALKMSNVRSYDIVEISPLVSRNGLYGLDDVRMELRYKYTVGFPLLIGSDMENM